MGRTNKQRHYHLCCFRARPSFYVHYLLSCLHRGGTTECTVTGARKHSSNLPQGGLKVPCLLKFKTDDVKECSKTRRLLISLMSEFLEGSSVQSSCTLCIGNSYTKPTAITSLLIAARAEIVQMPLFLAIVLAGSQVVFRLPFLLRRSMKC